ncbi:DNA-binding response regulator [Brevibacterium sp. HMSC08F02]|uniref:response regulator n=1 Tax=unclassified Brevibacterium TaxID=2614124 RepID=UPI0008A3CBDC|nr:MULTISPECIES: response regulator transcription factor [unclassified Brevibacterium]OFT25681.1 DNA-binding response regulator [Brevibacterium sp. HMSC08F02]OFT95397.1 DNA-binding response regulator [Brevibacterium sp. HMSC22B09]
MTIRVLLVDDQALVRAGFAMVIDSQDDMKVIAQAENGREAVNTVAAQAVDVVLMDIRMPVLDGLSATAEIMALGDARKLPRVPTVIVLTTFDTDEYALSALRSGASGFLLKDARPEVLLDSIRQAHTGGAVIAPSTTRRLLQTVIAEPAPPTEHAQKLERLTAREREVFQLIAQGKSNAEIGDELFMAEPTVKTHVRNILAKLGVRDRIHAVILAYETGIV